MDIRKFFVVKQQKNPASETAKNGKPKSECGGKKQPDLSKVKSLNSDDDDDSAKKTKQRGNKKKRVIIDTDSEEDVPVKKHRKPSKESPSESKSSSKPAHPPKKDPVVYVSETDEEDNFESLKQPQKRKENGLSASSRPGSTGRAVEVKPPAKPVEVKPPAKAVTPAKCTPMSVFEYFGGSSVQRSDKKLVATTKRKAPTGSTDDSTNEDEAIAHQLQMDEDAELERQLHEDEDFARTLAMLDEPPKPKKVRVRQVLLEQAATTPQLGQVLLEQAATTPQLGQVLLEQAATTPQLGQVLLEQAATTPQLGQVLLEQAATTPQLGQVLLEQAAATRQLGQVLLEQAATTRHVPYVVGSFIIIIGQARKDSASLPVKTSPGKPDGATIKQEEPSVSARDSPSKKPSPSKASSKLALMKRKEETLKKETPVKEKTVSPKKEEMVTPKTERMSPKKSESNSPEDSEKKRHNVQAYRNYLNRDGPRALGSKEMPKGADNCLEGLVFVLTGVLESMERDDGLDPVVQLPCGVSGYSSAESLGTNILDEDGLLDLIRKQPGKRSKYEIAAQAENKKSMLVTPEKPAKRAGSAKRETPTPPKRGSSPSTVAGKKSLSFQQSSLEKVETPAPSESKGESLLWVDRYKPTSLKNIIGQQGDQSCANKLLRWLRNWHHNAATKFSKFGGKDDGSTFKAALLSGPPGVGKTTTAALVCEELGFSYVEQNASCTRSKNSLKVVIAESLNNTSIKNFYSGTSQTVSSKHVLIMDEVDGMAGNEDRGGIQELIGLIKNTKIPIICMCNDRNHQKIRALVNYCFDLRFQRPRVEQIKGAMMSIAFKEGLKVPPPALNEIILAANQDIRQVLHNLSMWSARDKVFTYDQAKSDSSNARKDIKMGPFDVCRKVFAAGDEAAHMSLIDKSDLFFHDYSLAPLFVQENYVHVRPAAAGGSVKKHLMLLSRTADSICDGDLVDRQIRSRQMWTLLPTQAIYASVLPGELMRGYMSQFPTFPSWLGKFSATGKHDRIIQELSMHMCLRTQASKRAVNMEYLPFLRDSLVRPMAGRGAEGVPEAVQLMDDYCLMKEDVDNIMEISTWGGRPDPFSKLDPKVKSAFTRTYNKEVHLTPYSLQAVKKGKRGAGSTVDLGDEFGTEDTQPEEKESEDTIETDAMIKNSLDDTEQL
ncbi:Replication factor C subunit 1 [Acipenser ruthenus]|uniref:Replication factor C subunit 1 n=1 Tax=Acipenser ruthenus TaxID=7906 RepID=A0A444U954_ACIRT|nr:Replication factor C subunit 1 [Acipenser ruthenus]